MTNNDKVPELTNGDFDKFTGEGIALIDFFADWCMPCMMMGPVIDDLSEKFGGKIKIGKVNVAEEQEIASKFNVSSIPAFKVFKDGEVVDEFVGAVSAEELEEKLNSYL